MSVEPSPTDFIRAPHPTSRRVHLVEEDKPTRLVPSADGLGESVVAICGVEVDESFRRFKGFGKHRDIDWCRMCQRIVEHRRGGGVLFDDEPG